jgi:hypothetical protein
MSQVDPMEEEVPEEVVEPEYPSCHTLYIKNLNEKMKLHGKPA